MPNKIQDAQLNLNLKLGDLHFYLLNLTIVCVDLALAFVQAIIIFLFFIVTCDII